MGGTKMKAYKGFKTDMTCRGFQFEEGKEYHEDSAVLCNSGFHACEAPLDCFGYYSPAESVYHEVELDEVSDEREPDSKICGKNIKIGARLNIANLCKLQFDYVKSHCTNEYNAEKGKAATAGNYGAATAGNYGAATAGERGAATAGYRGAATAGNYGAATSRGSVAVGDNGVALCRGNDIKARGGLGSILVIVVESEDNYDIKEWKAEVVDGVKIKADTWYKLENGEFVEIEDETT
jgi:hypothetical protein